MNVSQRFRTVSYFTPDINHWKCHGYFNVSVADWNIFIRVTNFDWECSFHFFFSGSTLLLLLYPFLLYIGKYIWGFHCTSFSFLLLVVFSSSFLSSYFFLFSPLLLILFFFYRLLRLFSSFCSSSPRFFLLFVLVIYIFLVNYY